MSLPDSYLEYPLRRRGNDHDRFPFVPLPKRPPVRWPEDAKLAMFVTVNFEYYPLSAPPPAVSAYGAVGMPAPDYIQYTLTDYGNRIGAYRLFRALDEHGIKATAIVNSEMARLYPRLIEEILARGWEIAASGIDMSQPITGAMTLQEERALIKESLSTLRECTQMPVVGWHSPAFSQSMSTMDLIAEQGVEYVLDWINDDMPYAVRTASGSLHALPISDQWADANIVGAQRQLTSEIHRQGIAAFRALKAEAEDAGGRVFSLPLHPVISGQPFRIGTVERLLADIVAEGGFWAATGQEILTAFTNQDTVG